MSAPHQEQPSLGFLLVRLGEAIDRQFVAALLKLELRPRELRVLVLLDIHRASSQRALAELLGVDPGNLVALLDRLESRGLVTRRVGADDRRRRALQLTPAGVRLLRQARAATQTAEDLVLAPLDDDRRAQLEEIALDLWRAAAAERSG